ncbi:bacillithiol biosynthesis deacetylase BshB1 [candidate division LCP-89 bacterium B3_LCP]|uniref:Bacillithiol biosynthesis deacetylase BshB1 n=1 Tax=candidate division LCP-89 bacterium B3_LCP TaxID=2012998 RepID=A0A532UPT0_UNCL8|nr:MAG: bacillithiol biosynthesis deacetylase BshB1 [candidate division LCP-89 bacterium B3_LCP]
MKKKNNHPAGLDVLAVGSHPDDIELSCAGTLIKLARMGYRVGILDLTEGEMGTRGSEEERHLEAQNAAEIMGLTVRENAGLPDGHLQPDWETKLTLIKILRKYRPKLWIIPLPRDRHPDHAATGQAAQAAAFLAGLRKVDTGQEPFRPTWTLNYFLRWEDQPSFVVDVSDTFETRIEAIKAYSSQFDPKTEGPKTFISRPQFLEGIIARAKYYGSKIEAAYGEPFKSQETLRVDDPVKFLTGIDSEWATLR